MIGRIIGSAAVMTAVVLSAAVTETPGTYRREILENRLVRLEFLPDSLGRLDQIQLKNSGRKLLLERTVTKVSVDPLYEFFRNNTFGCGENFWKNYVARRDGKSLVARPDAASISFANNWYGALPVNVKRKVILLPDETLFTFEAEVFNRDSKKPFFLAPWYSFFTDDASTSKLLIPAAGGKKSHKLGNANFFPADTIAVNPSGLVSPIDNWAATIYPADKTILAIIVPPEEFFPDGAFYSWHGKSGNKSYYSMEVILNGANLPTGKSRKFRCQFALFSGIDNLLDIAGTTAIDAKISDGKLLLTLAPARKNAAGKMIVNINCSGAKKVVELNIPELLPGKSYTFSAPFDGAGKCRVTGKLPDGSSFDLTDIK